jgi:predicted secreted protein
LIKEDKNNIEISRLDSKMLLSIKYERLEFQGVQMSARKGCSWLMSDAQSNKELLTYFYNIRVHIWIILLKSSCCF